MALDEKTVSVLKPDVLAPAEIEQKSETSGVAKTTMPFYRTVVLGILAGMFIAFGGMMMSLVVSDAAIPFVAQRLLGGFVFCLGLLLVVLTGAELFTGNTLIITAVLSKKVTWKAFAKNLVIIWLTNCIGALIVVALVYYANVGAMNGGAIGDTFIKLAAAKVALPPLELFAKAIICNIMVCLGSYLASAGKTLTDKFFGVLLPIITFIAVAGEHCVANMFFLPMGLVESVAGNAVSDAAVLAAGAIDMSGIFYNLCISTAGNIVGGAVLVGMMYWIAFHKKKAS